MYVWKFKWEWEYSETVIALREIDAVRSFSHELIRSRRSNTWRSLLTFFELRLITINPEKSPYLSSYILLFVFEGGRAQRVSNFFQETFLLRTKNAGRIIFDKILIWEKILDKYMQNPFKINKYLILLWTKNIKYNIS